MTISQMVIMFVFCFITQIINMAGVYFTVSRITDKIHRRGEFETVRKARQS